MDDHNNYDFEEEEEDELAEAELDNYCNMKEELRRQLRAVVEENEQLREGNQKLLESLDELRQRKEELLDICNTNLRLAEQLTTELKTKQQLYNELHDTTENSNTEDDRGSSCGTTTRKLDYYTRKYLPSWAATRPSYSASPLLTTYTSPGSGSSLYKRAMDYARYSHSSGTSSSSSTSSRYGGYDRSSHNFHVWHRHYL